MKKSGSGMAGDFSARATEGMISRQSTNAAMGRPLSKRRHGRLRTPLAPAPLHRLKNSSSALTYWNVGFHSCPASGIDRNHFGSFAAA